MEASGFTEGGSPSNGHKRHKNGIGQRLEPCFVPFVLFVVEPFTPFAGQQEVSRTKLGERSFVGQVPRCCYMEMLDSEFCKRLHFQSNRRGTELPGN